MLHENITVKCELCKTNAVNTAKGGVYNEEVKMWFVCVKCAEKVDDRRTKERRKGNADIS